MLTLLIPSNFTLLPSGVFYYRSLYFEFILNFVPASGETMSSVRKGYRHDTID